MKNVSQIHSRRQARAYLNQLGHAAVSAANDPDPRPLIDLLNLLRRCAPLEATRFLRGMFARRERRREQRLVGRFVLILDTGTDEQEEEEAGSAS